MRMNSRLQHFFKNKFVAWGFFIIVVGAISFFTVMSFEPREITDYNLTDFDTKAEHGAKCDRNDADVYYVCENGYEVFECFCTAERTWDCLPEPERFCILGEDDPLAALREGEGSTEPEGPAGSLEASPNPATLLAPICFDEPCEVETTFTITSSGNWYIDNTRNYATSECGPAPGGTRWSICPTEGGPGETTVTIKNRVYGVSTPSDFDELIKDGYGTWVIRLKDEFETKVEVDAYMELSKY